MTKQKQVEPGVLAVVNDLQVGSDIAILDPSSLLSRWDDKNSIDYTIPVQLNPAQQYLFDLYRSGIEKTIELAKDRNVYVIVNGDMTQGDRFMEGLSYPLLSDQVQIATDLICRWLQYPQVKSIRLTRSTQVHAFKEGHADHAIAKKIREAYKGFDVKLVTHGLLNVGGVWVDYAHHGPPGGVRTHLKGNLLRYYTQSLIAASMRDREPVPNIVLRAHKHERIEERITTFRKDERVYTLAMTVPSFQLLTPFAQKATTSESNVTNGMVAIEVGDGDPRVHWFAETRSYRHKESL